MEELSVLSPEKANYIIKVRRGGKVSHVWELEDALVKYSDQMKGWEIFTAQKAAIFVSGDVEIWRLDEKPVKPAPPEPKKEPVKLPNPFAKKPSPPAPPPATVREIYEKVYRKFDIRSSLFPDKNDLEPNA